MLFSAGVSPAACESSLPPRSALVFLESWPYQNMSEPAAARCTVIKRILVAVLVTWCFTFPSRTGSSQSQPPQTLRCQEYPRTNLNLQKREVTDWGYLALIQIFGCAAWHFSYIEGCHAPRQHVVDIVGLACVHLKFGNLPARTCASLSCLYWFLAGWKVCRLTFRTARCNTCETLRIHILGIFVPFFSGLAAMYLEVTFL